jgi:large subunit ribosomal protein L21
MYAIIRTGGKQFRAEPGKTITVPSLAAEVGEAITFEDVLVAATDDGVQVGAPTVAGARVTGEVVEHGKGRKIIVFKWKRRKNYRRKQGHRQKYTAVRIDQIQAG